MAEIDSFKKVNQTCKSVIFEEFNKEVPSFYDLLSIADDPTTEAFDDDLKNRLVVHNYDEFLKKFMPKVYEICTADADGKPKYVYTTDYEFAKKQGGVPIDIKDHSYYKMLVQMYTEKASSGESNLHFDDSKILDMLTPKQEVEDAKDLRKKFKLSVEKYLDLKNKGENPSEYAQKIVECRQKISEKYKDSPIGLLPLAIEDVKTKLEYLEQTAPTNNSEVDSLPNYAAQLTFADDGKLVLEHKEIEEITSDKAATDDRVPALIQQTIENDYRETTGNDEGFVKSLVLRTYAPLDVKREDSLKTIEEQKQEYHAMITEYESVYSQAKKSFIKEITSLIEKLLGVKVFFDHAGVKGEFKEGVLITNCRADKLISSSVKDKFEKFMMDKGLNQPKKKIWFAVLPAVADKAEVKLQADDPFGGPLNSSASDKLNDADLGKGECISFNAAKAVLSILNKSKIMTVFNFKASPKSGFAALSSKYIAEKKDKLTEANVTGDHMVFAYPNFTLTRERRKPISKYSNEEIDIPGVYIEASYVAAGLLVGSQQIAYLENHGFKGKLNKNNVCVHVDLEKPEIKKQITTNFNQEVSLRWSQDIRDEINRDDFGFVFSSDEIYVNDEPIKNTYVYLARTLKANSQGRYKQIYHVLTEDFVRQYLSAINTRITSEEVAHFIDREVKIWSDEYKKKDSKDFINLTLNTGDEITYDKESKKIKIKFGNDESFLDDLDIEAE